MVFISDVGSVADKINLIPQDFFAELVSRAINGLWENFWHSVIPEKLYIWPFLIFVFCKGNVMYVVA